MVTVWRGKQKSEQEVMLQSLRGPQKSGSFPALAGPRGLPAGGDALAETYKERRAQLGMGWQGKAGSSSSWRVLRCESSGLRDLQMSPSAQLMGSERRAIKGMDGDVERRRLVEHRCL